MRVELCDEWDVVGAGCASGLFGAGESNPTFAVTSLSSGVVMVAGYWQVGIGFAVASRPERIAKLREPQSQLGTRPAVSLIV
ncbi:hypothetical protein [Streptomyces mirabilis]|uniref:hypothetical protein n=1 Tax=Streptomyces mirabilis TaxID=68239 RepID=UPI0035D8B359